MDVEFKAIVQEVNASSLQQILFYRIDLLVISKNAVAVSFIAFFIDCHTLPCFHITKNLNPWIKHEGRRDVLFRTTGTVDAEGSN